MTYVFWVRGWHCIPDIGGGTFSRCRVTDEAIYLDLPPTKSHTGTSWTIPLSQIVSCEPYLLRSRSLSVQSVHLKFESLTITINQWKRKELYLHIIEPIWGDNAKSEAECLTNVIEAKKTKQEINFNPNAYFRSFERHNRLHEFKESEWDMMKHISTFQEQPIIKEIIYERRLANLKGGSFVLYAAGAFALFMIGYLSVLNELDGALAMTLLASPLVVLIFYIKRQIRKLESER